MTQSRRPISFIATSDPETAKLFYGEVLSLELQETSPYALVFADGHHVLRVQIVPDFTPASFTVHGWQVSNIDRNIDELTAKGVEFLMFDQLKQDARCVWTSPDGHKIAWMKDPCGNTLSLTENAQP